ncbi:MAG: hypothetical protein ABSA39_08085 [Edaphobacter sp.]
MFKQIARNLALILALTAFVAPAIHAQATTSAVTGGDPEPTSPNPPTSNVIQTILLILSLA